jgi:IPT/TIG domain
VRLDLPPGSVAPGLQINAETGAITGTPTEPGQLDAEIVITDSSFQPQRITPTIYIMVVKGPKSSGSRPTTSTTKSPNISGKVTVKCGSTFSAQPEASASYRVGGQVGLDGSITITVHCGANGKPATAPKPTVAATSTQKGTSGTSVVVGGAGLSGAQQVLFGTTPAQSFKVVSANQINAVAPAGKGTVPITVEGPKGKSALSLAARFTYTSPGTSAG